MLGANLWSLSQNLPRERSSLSSPVKGEDSGEGDLANDWKQSSDDRQFRLSLAPPHPNLLPRGEKGLLRHALCAHLLGVQTGWAPENHDSSLEHLQKSRNSASRWLRTDARRLSRYADLRKRPHAAGAVNTIERNHRQMPGPFDGGSQCPLVLGANARLASRLNLGLL